MTKVILHGILAKEFNKNFDLAIARPKEVFDAISCVYANFRNRVVELHNQGIHFVLLIDGKKITNIEEMSVPLKDQVINIVPLICGHGIVAGVVGAIATVAGSIGSALAGIGAFLASGTAAANLAMGIAMMGIQMLLAPKPEMNRPESTVNSTKQSFLFASKANTSEQGIPVPVGYGRLRAGSAVIQLTLKSYPEAFNKEKSIETLGQAITNDRKL